MGLPAKGHAWTQAFILLSLLGMIYILFDLIRKFRANNVPATNRSKTVQTHSSNDNDSSLKSPSSGSTTGQSASTQNIRKRRKRKPILKFYKITSLLSISSFIIAVAIDFGDGVYYFDSGIDVFHTADYWLVVLTNIGFGISTISLYVFMVGRLYLTFKDSEYRLNKWTLYVVTGLIMINAVAIIFYTICIAMIYDYLFISKHFYEYLNASFITILCADFVLNAAILSLFLYKLQQIISSLECDYNIRYDATNMEENDDDDDDNAGNRKISINLSIQQTKMITIMTRHTILSSIAIFFNILFYISIIYGSNIEILEEADLFFLAYSNLIKALHGLAVAFASFYLNFGFNNDLYLKLCNKYHLFCYNGFVKLTKNKMKKKEDDSLQLAVNNVNK